MKKDEYNKAIENIRNISLSEDKKISLFRKLDSYVLAHPVVPKGAFYTPLLRFVRKLF